MRLNPISGNTPDLPATVSPKKFYHTGKSLRARWQRLRLWLAYRRPVTFLHLRRIAHDAMYREGDYHRPDPAAEAVFEAVIREAEKPVWR